MGGHRQERTVKGRGSSRRRNKKMRKRWGSKRVTRQVVVTDSPAPGPPWDLRDALEQSGIRSNRAALKSSSTRDEALCCQPCRWVPGSKVSGVRDGGLAPNRTDFQEGGSKFMIPGPAKPWLRQPLPQGKGWLDAPPTKTPIEQQPRGEGHPPWGCSQPSSHKKQSALCELRFGAPNHPARSVAASHIPTSLPKTDPKIWARHHHKPLSCLVAPQLQA